MTFSAVKGSSLSLFCLTFVAGLAFSSNAHACAYTGDSQGIPVFQSCPKTLTTSLETAVKCHTLGGELAGDGSLTDKKTTAKMKTLHCARSDSEVAETSRIYSKNPELTAVITHVEKDYELDQAE